MPKYNIRCPKCDGPAVGDGWEHRENFDGHTSCPFVGMRMRESTYETMNVGHDLRRMHQKDIEEDAQDLIV